MYLDNKNISGVKILWLLRDSQQSTLPDNQWIMSGRHLIQLMRHAVSVGFPGIEIGGGRFWEICMLSGQNPFRLMHKAHSVIEEEDTRENPIELQVLLRGSNGMGFDPVDISVQKELVKQHAQAGIYTFRTFDALNDINNVHCLNINDDVHFQAALAYTVDGTLKAGESPIYTIEYYVNYAKRLRRKGFKSVCIKDMAGQLDANTVKTLVTALKAACDCPVTLHIHSTDHERSLRTIYAAIGAQVDGIELAVYPLDGGAGHHDFRTFIALPEIQRLEESALDGLEENLAAIADASKRVDVLIPTKVRNKLCAAGVPGGAIPSVVAMLEGQFRKEMVSSDDIDRAIFLDRYIDFVGRVRQDAGNVPLVTPSADIVCRQAVFSLSSNRHLIKPAIELSLEEMYGNVTPDFARLVLGHFGMVYCYGDVTADVEEVEVPISYPNITLIDMLSTRTVTGDKPFENLWLYHSDGVMRARRMQENLPTFSDFVAEVDAFISRLADVLAVKLRRNVAQHIAENIVYRFANREQLALFLAMPPKGKNARFLWLELVLSDFFKGGNKSFDLSQEEALELMETLYGLQCLPNAWKSKSSDLYTLAAYMPKIQAYFKKELLAIDAQIEEARQHVCAEREEKWMYRGPTNRGKIYALEARRNSVFEQLNFCGTVNADEVLADNEPARLVLNHFIYPAISQYIEPIDAKI